MTEPTTADASTDTEPPFTCPYCDGRFTTRDYRALHWGVRHEGALTEEEHEAYEAAHEREEAALRLFRLKALLVLVVIYFGFIMLYSFFGIQASV